MSSRLAMVLMTAILLMAAMAIPTNGPEKASGEMERRLDLRGEWEGAFWDSDDIDKGSWKVEFSDDWLERARGIDAHQKLWKMTDEGGGRKVKRKLLRLVCDGIYRQEGNCVIIAPRDGKISRAVSFGIGNRQDLLILHRVKPGK